MKAGQMSTPHVKEALECSFNASTKGRLAS